jgi:DNA polymerase
MKVISLDFELCSTLDLTVCGTDVWTKHPKTTPIVCGFAIDYGEPEVIQFDDIAPRLTDQWSLSDQNENELLVAVQDGAEIHAWNANFEWNVWNNICVPRFEWPTLPIERFHCVMASASCAGLPMNLNDAAKAVGSPHVKDKLGQALMMRMAKPRRFDSKGEPVWWHRSDDEAWAKLTPAARAKAQLKVDQMLTDLIAYNVKDVLAEREVHLRIPRMTKRERDVWLADQRMNARGLPVDADLLTKLHEITLQELIDLNREICRITKGAVPSSTTHAKLLQWVQLRGYPHKSLEKDTLGPFIGSHEFFELDLDVQDVLTLRAEAAKTSTAKLKSVAAYSQLDDRARNLIQYGGAVRTLRWAGRGPQIQNFPRPTLKNPEDAISEIKLGMDAPGLRMIFGQPLDVVSSCLRGVFAAPAGSCFAVADYTSIEAIVLSWLAEFEPRLNVFRRKEDIYLFTAKGVGSDNRQLGKVLTLACGYGMGHVKFLSTANGPPYNLDLTLPEAQVAVAEFRRANAPIVALWHACEACAGNAILNPGTAYTFKRLKFRMANPNGRLAKSLLMELPSGRNLVYRNARVQSGRIVFWGVDQYTKQWREQDTYGGKLVENATQAVARDLLADAVVELEALALTGALCTTVHDEIVAEVYEDAAPGFLARMLDVMAHPEPWAAGMPVSAKGDILARYGKL